MNPWRWIGLALALTWTGALAAQSPIPWETTLENAQRVAAQTNRLVLVHFWAPWCGPCRQMEAEVFSRADVGQRIAQQYVPVKINADTSPNLVQRLGVTGYPADVVLDAQGQIIQRQSGRKDAASYVTDLERIAVAYRNAAPRTDLPAGPAVPSVPAVAAAVPPVPVAPAAASAPAAGDRYANVDRTQIFGASSPPVAAQPVAVAPAYGQAMPPPPANPLPPASDLPPAMPPTTPVANAPLTTAPPAAAAPPTIPAETTSAANAPMAAAAAPAAQSNHPPFGLEGFCPVSLYEKGQWTRGDPQYGVIHRGRTYLFVGPQEKQRFFAEPDRFAPVVSGYDVVLALEQGKNVPGRREHGVYFNRHVFLFADEASLNRFSKNPNYYADQALEALRTSAAVPATR